MENERLDTANPSIPLEQFGLPLPPGRWKELQPRLAVLLADFDELKALETDELEPLPAFAVTPEGADGWS